MNGPSSWTLWAGTVDHDPLPRASPALGRQARRSAVNRRPFEWTGRAVCAALGIQPPEGEDAVFTGVATDTRSAAPGSLFVALKGDRFDAHAFLDQALAAGCRGLVVRDGATVPGDEGVRVYHVPDPLVALGDLARFRRRQASVPVIGITGSSGKTTAKELTLAALSGHLPSHGTGGNLNNRVGLPLTILAMDPEASVLVLEMGTNQPGEIRELARVAEPTVGVVTTVSETHVELLGDLEGVLEEKLDLPRSVPQDGLVIVGDDPPVLADRARMLRPDVRVGGLSERADPGLRPLDLELRSDGTYSFWWNGQPVDLKLPGRHGVYNALLALAVAQYLGVPAQAAARGVSRVAPTAMRGETVVARGVTVILDCYNANPQSVRAAVQSLEERQTTGRRIAVLGSMLELGDRSPVLHRETLDDVLRTAVDRVLLVGDFASVASTDSRVVVFDDLDALGSGLAGELRKGDAALFKASRGVGLEAAYQSWSKGASPGDGEEKA